MPVNAYSVAAATARAGPIHQEIRALDETGTAHLLNAAKHSRLYRPVFIAVTTGMRRGELLALRWDTVDLERRVLSVRQALEQTKDGFGSNNPRPQKGAGQSTFPT